MTTNVDARNVRLEPPTRRFIALAVKKKNAQEDDGDGGGEYVAIIMSSEKDQNDLLVLSI